LSSFCLPISVPVFDGGARVATLQARVDDERRQRAAAESKARQVCALTQP
jgi:hypothetical protein